MLTCDFKLGAATVIEVTTCAPMSWAGRGACRDIDPDALFVTGAAQQRAKRICAACPVRMECLADALDNRMEFGVWGGMTERERRAMLRRRPDVVSWRKLLQVGVRQQDPLTGLLGTG